MTRRACRRGAGAAGGARTPAESVPASPLVLSLHLSPRARCRRKPGARAVGILFALATERRAGSGRWAAGRGTPPTMIHMNKGEILCSEHLPRHSHDRYRCSVSPPPWRGPRLEEAPRVEARALLGVLERSAARVHGLGCPGPSQVPRGRPTLGTPLDVQGSRAPLQRPPTRSPQRCATRYRLTPLRCQRRVASRNCGARASCRGHPPTRICSAGARRRVAQARASRFLHARPVLPHGSQACLRRARPRRLGAVGGGSVSSDRAARHALARV
jgi:hypothetical protein